MCEEKSRNIITNSGKEGERPDFDRWATSLNAGKLVRTPNFTGSEVEAVKGAREYLQRTFQRGQTRE